MDLLHARHESLCNISMGKRGSAAAVPGRRASTEQRRQTTTVGEFLASEELMENAHPQARVSSSSS